LLALLGEPELRGAALRGLAAFDDAKTASAVLGVYASLTPAEKRDALNTLASRLAYAKPLLSAVADQKVPRTDLTADLVRQLRNLKDAGFAKQIDEVWGVVKEATADQQKEITRVRAIYQAGGSQPGDAPRGRVLFNQLCAQCHHFFDFGGAVGPDITGANRGDVAYLLENILFPNAVIPIDYRVSTIEMKDDRVLTGIVKERTPQALVVQTANEKLTLPLAEVRKVEATENSMMPEGLIAQLKDQQIRDLLYYLGRPGQVPLPAVAK
jgi:putative heme-binding domain-containing protein